MLSKLLKLSGKSPGITFLNATDYDVIIHIGAPKTGSSAIQYFCLENRRALANSGFYYPEHNMDRNNVSGGHSVFGKTLKDGDFDKAKAIFGGWLSEAKKDDLCLLLSAESLFGKYQPIADICDGLKVAIIAYFRDPVESIISNYNQVVKRHFATTSLHAYVETQLRLKIPGVSGAIYEEWQALFRKENVVVLPYEFSSFPDGMIQKSFLTVLGIDQAEKTFKFKTGKVNRSYTASALELKRLINMITDHDKTKINNRIDWCLQHYSDHADIKPRSVKGLLGEGLYLALLDKFAESNDRMKKETLRLSSNNFLNCSSLHVSNEDISDTGFDSLQQVLLKAFSDDPDIIDYLRSKVLDQLSSSQFNSYSLLKLAELLGISIDRYDHLQPVIPDGQMKALLSEKSSAADYLREISLLMERCGFHKQAHAVIERALEIRQGGPGIIAIRDRLSKKLIKDK